ncbi:sensor histidine kinase [Runella sp.]|uniref:sensor histidine kinase n=1 Tax=Runella sp. TaxID=1960881 RepID=UPI003D0A6826
MINSLNREYLLTFGAISVFLLMLVLFIVIIVGLFKKRQTEYRREKIDLLAHYQQETLRAQLEVQNQTLKQIGQDLHDNIGQLLSVMGIHLDVLEEEMTDAKTKGQIIEISTILHRIISDVRALTKSLDGDFVNDFGLVESISHELQRIRRTGKYQTEILIEGETYKLEGEKEIVLFRVVQEILNNILKHAAAKHIKLYLHYAPELFTLTVRDDGKGFNREDIMSREFGNSGAGLRNIQHRAEMLGGSFQLDSTLETGTKIQIQLPVIPQIP